MAGRAAGDGSQKRPPRRRGIEMTAKELREALSLTVLSETDPDRTVTGGYAGDLLSWVMGRAQSGDAWVTIMTNRNIIAVAVLADTACVIVAENAAADAEFAEKAKTQGITVLHTEKPVFDAALMVHERLA